MAPLERTNQTDDVILAVCQTAFGWVGMAQGKAGLLMVTLPQQSEEAALRLLWERWGMARRDDEALASLSERLQRYFAGEPVSFADLPLDMRQVTPFRRRVYEAARAIPWGQTRTYGQLARQVGSPGAARAVGQAMATNPWAVVVPCHRVVGHDGRLVGFGGGLDLKRRMLELEGV